MQSNAQREIPRRWHEAPPSCSCWEEAETAPGSRSLSLTRETPLFSCLGWPLESPPLARGSLYVRYYQLPKETRLQVGCSRRSREDYGRRKGRSEPTSDNFFKKGESQLWCPSLDHSAPSRSWAGVWPWWDTLSTPLLFIPELSVQIPIQIRGRPPHPPMGERTWPEAQLPGCRPPSPCRVSPWATLTFSRCRFIQRVKVLFCTFSLSTKSKKVSSVMGQGNLCGPTEPWGFIPRVSWAKAAASCLPAPCSRAHWLQPKHRATHKSHTCTPLTSHAQSHAFCILDENRNEPPRPWLSRSPLKKQGGRVGDSNRVGVLPCARVWWSVPGAPVRHSPVTSQRCGLG